MKVTYRQPGTDNYGLFLAIEGRIEIDDDLSNEATRRVAIHELTHAALSVSGITEIINNMPLEEAICTMMESFAADLIRLNDTMK